MDKEEEIFYNLIIVCSLYDFQFFQNIGIYKILFFFQDMKISLSALRKLGKVIPMIFSVFVHLIIVCNLYFIFVNKISLFSKNQ